MTVPPTGSDRVVAALNAAGGTAPRADVLAALSEQIGRRGAGLAIGMSTLLGRVDQVVQPNGRISLTIADGDRDA